MKINAKNTKKLSDAIIKNEGKSWARTMDASDVQSLIPCIEDMLRIIAPKKEWTGSKFMLTIGCHIAQAYNGTPMATFITIEYLTSGWFVTKIERLRVKDKSIHPIKLPNLRSQSMIHRRKIFNMNL